MSRRFLIAAITFALSSIEALACSPMLQRPMMPLESIVSSPDVFIGKLSLISRDKQRETATYSVEVVRAFKGALSGKLAYFSYTSSAACGYVPPDGIYLFHHANSSLSVDKASKVPRLPLSGRNLKFDRVDDAIGVVEHLMAVVASSKNAVLTIDGAASMANPREVTISGPAELASRVQAAISSSGTCQPELGAHYPGIYINRDQGYWIDWGLRIAPRNRENGCGQPLTRQFKEPGTHRVLAGMMTPGKSKQTSVMPLEWKWFGTVVVTVK